MESRLLNWAKKRAVVREREDRRRDAQAAKDKASGYIPATNHSRRRRKAGETELRYADPATVAGARLYGAGVQWQRDAALAIARQEAKKTEDDLLAVRSNPEINEHSKTLASKDAVRTKRVVLDLDSHQSQYMKTVEEKKGERAKTFKNAAKVEEAIAARLAKEQAKERQRLAEKDLKMAKIAEDAAETVKETLRAAEESRTEWKPPRPPPAEAADPRSSRRVASPIGRTGTRRERNKAASLASQQRAGLQSPQQTNSPTEEDQPAAADLSLQPSGSGSDDGKQKKIPSTVGMLRMKITSPISVPRRKQKQPVAVEQGELSLAAESAVSSHVASIAGADRDGSIEGKPNGDGRIDVGAIGTRNGLGAEIQRAIHSAGGSPPPQVSSAAEKAAQEVGRRELLLEERATEEAKFDRFAQLAAEADKAADMVSPLPAAADTEALPADRPAEEQGDSADGPADRSSEEAEPPAQRQAHERPANMPPLPHQENGEEGPQMDADTEDAFIELLIDIGAMEDTAIAATQFLADLGVVTAADLAGLGSDLH